MTPISRLASTTLATLLLAPAAWAGVGHIAVDFDGTPAEIVVYSDGNRFTHIEQSKLDYLVSQEIDCGRGEKVKHAVLAAGANAIANPGGNVGAAPRVWTETYAGDKRAVLFQVDLDDYYMAPFGSPNPVEICNRELDRRAAQGQSRYTLLQQGFTVAHGHTVTLAANCTDKNDPVEPLWGQWPNSSPHGWKNATDSVISTIRCKARQPTFANPTAGPPTASNDLAVPFQVRSVKLHAQAPNQPVVCPATVELRATFEVVGKGAVRYRGNLNGGLGPIKTLRFDGSGTRQVTYSVEVGRASAPPPSGPGTGIVHGGGLAPVPGSGDMPGLDTANGWARIEIVSPEAGADHSPKAHFSVRCRDVPNFQTPTQPTKPEEKPDTRPSPKGRSPKQQPAEKGGATTGRRRVPSGR